MKSKKIIISRYKEDISWVNDYDLDHIIYNKGNEIDGNYNVLKMDNIGNNQRDIFHYILNNYDKLEDIMVFVQGNPFDHCKREKFDTLINNEIFTALESFEDIQQNNAQILDSNGGYMEINNSWYIGAHNATHNQFCIYGSFDDFMNKTFKNYTSEHWNRFTPGSQYIITKEIAHFYSKNFWSFLMNSLNKNNMTEGHIIERSLWKIFNCYLEPIDTLK